MYIILSLSSDRILSEKVKCEYTLQGNIRYSSGNEFICLPAKIKKEGKPAIFIIKVNTSAFENIMNKHKVELGLKEKHIQARKNYKAISKA